ncbi:MAG: succinate dehydrogenase, cytochrome b556 subunit [Vitreoscilla sp.]|nr:succinate dehydrogenase, cytochrome b556 subunit [Vitreoscilla sp.]MBP6674342.1 succinate dehydrogenase, cytochrome b556 subunit [Vitreoscilla sp.]
MADTLKQRPEFRNINAMSDLPNYRLPIAGIVSILHRVSGLLMFVLLPFIIWMFDTSVTSEVSYDGFRSVFIAGVAFVPGWFFKLVALTIIWAYLHHWLAGIRHIRMDIKHTVTKEQGQSSAQIVLAISLTLTVLLAAKLFGLY